MHAVQNARRSAGLAVEDRIELLLSGDSDLVGAAKEHRDYVAGETLAVGLQLGADTAAAGPLGYAEESEIDGRALTIQLGRARRG